MYKIHMTIHVVSPCAFPSGIEYLLSVLAVDPLGTVMRIMLPSRVSRLEAKLFGSKGGPPSPTDQYRSSSSTCDIIRNKNKRNMCIMNHHNKKRDT